jgi:beta-galactosidase
VALSRGPATAPPNSLPPTADASFTGGVFSGFDSDFGFSTTLPATMLDGDASTYWSNRYTKVATQTLDGVTNARPGDWVSVAWAPAKRVGSMHPSFIVDANDELPAAVTVSYWTGTGWAPVSDQQVNFAAGSNTPSTITFTPVTTTKLKLDMTSAAPYDPTTGNLAISTLQIPGVT